MLLLGSFQGPFLFRSNVASGQDGISSKMLKGTASVISEHLLQIFNLSFSSASVPSDWKISRVVPILKSGDPSDANNYCPISLLSLILKIQECLIHSTLTQHLSDNELLSNHQFGFMPGSSTQEAILTITHSSHQVLENGSMACKFYQRLLIPCPTSSFCNLWPE